MVSRAKSKWYQHQKIWIIQINTILWINNYYGSYLDVWILYHILIFILFIFRRWCKSKTHGRARNRNKKCTLEHNLPFRQWLWVQGVPNYCLCLLSKFFWTWLYWWSYHKLQSDQRFEWGNGVQSENTQY